VIGPHRLALLLALLLVPLAGLPAAAAADASNTSTRRSYTSEWVCDNGRPVLFNAHPARPREEAWITYLGNRVEVKLKSGRFVSADGKVSWQVQRPDKSSSRSANDAVATLTFDGLLDQPISCMPKPKSAAK
jgi:hypothetical protein